MDQIELTEQQQLKIEAMMNKGKNVNYTYIVNKNYNNDIFIEVLDAFINKYHKFCCTLTDKKEIRFHDKQIGHLEQCLTDACLGKIFPGRIAYIGKTTADKQRVSKSLSGGFKSHKTVFDHIHHLFPEYFTRKTETCETEHELSNKETRDIQVLDPLFNILGKTNNDSEKLF